MPTAVLDQTGTHVRYFDLRYDGERTLSGTAMRYGDVADLPWGEQERFTPGAFGDIGQADVILNRQHDRGRPLARTGGGGLELRDTASELRITATLPDTTEANEALTLVRSRILRGFSIEFSMDGYPRSEDGVTVVERATLRAVALVDRPAYPQALVDRRQLEMNEQRIRQLIEEQLSEQENEDQEPAAVDVEAIARSVSTTLAAEVQEQVRTQIAEALAERDAAQEAQQAAETAAAEAEEEARRAEEQILAASSERAELILSVNDLLPDDADTRAMSNHDILVAAAGEEVENAAERSEDYLRGRIEEILRRREAAAAAAPSVRTPSAAPMAAAAGRVDVTRYIERRDLVRR